MATRRFIDKGRVVVMSDDDLLHITLSSGEDRLITKAALEALLDTLPAHSAEDDGKVLRLVNGVPAWVHFDNAEEVAF